jgi:hypothetical protein
MCHDSTHLKGIGMSLCAWHEGMMLVNQKEQKEEKNKGMEL